MKCLLRLTSEDVRARSQIPVVGVTGRARAGPALLNYPALPYSRRINTIRQKGSAWHVLPTFEYQSFLFTPVDLAIDKADLAAVVIHKWVPMHGIYFIPRFCPQNPAPGATNRPPRPRPVRPYIRIWLRALRWLDKGKKKKKEKKKKERKKIKKKKHYKKINLNSKNLI